MTAAIRNRLTAAAARAERLAQRNRDQAAQLRKAARGMGDQATTFAARPADTDDARAQQVRAIRGRYLARQLASDGT